MKQTNDSIKKEVIKFYRDRGVRHKGNDIPESWISNIKFNPEDKKNERIKDFWGCWVEEPSIDEEGWAITTSGNYIYLSDETGLVYKYMYGYSGLRWVDYKDGKYVDIGRVDSNPPPEWLMKLTEQK